MDTEPTETQETTEAPEIAEQPVTATESNPDQNEAVPTTDGTQDSEPEQPEAGTKDEQPETESDKHEEPSSTEAPADTTEPIVNEETDAAPVVTISEAAIHELIAQITQLQQQVSELQQRVEHKYLLDSNRQTIIDRQHNELEIYRQDTAGKLRRELALDIIAEIDALEKNAAYYADQPFSEETYNKLLKRTSEHAEDLIDLLERHDIIAYRSEAGTMFDGKRHRLLKSVPTTDPTKVRQIEESLRWGFEYNGKAVRAELVSVYVQDKSTPANS